MTEDPVKWYVPEIKGFTITNRYQPETTSVKVRKEWDDAGSDKLRPKSIKMTLSNGMSVVLSEKNGWAGMITGLPTYVNGEPAEYTWEEPEVLGYVQKSVEIKDGVTVFTNKPFTREGNPPKGKTPKLPIDPLEPLEDYDTPLGVDVMINHVGDCFD